MLMGRLSIGKGLDFAFPHLIQALLDQIDDLPSDIFLGLNSQEQAFQLGKSAAFHKALEDAFHL